jgi:hypothetical protein
MLRRWLSYHALVTEKRTMVQRAAHWWADRAKHAAAVRLRVFARNRRHVRGVIAHHLGTVETNLTRRAFMALWRVTVGVKRFRTRCVRAHAARVLV